MLLKLSQISYNIIFFKRLLIIYKVYVVKKYLKSTFHVDITSHTNIHKFSLNGRFGHLTNVLN